MHFVFQVILLFFNERRLFFTADTESYVLTHSEQKGDISKNSFSYLLFDFLIEFFAYYGVPTSVSC